MLLPCASLPATCCLCADMQPAGRMQGCMRFPLRYKAAPLTRLNEVAWDGARPAGAAHSKGLPSVPPARRRHLRLLPAACSHACLGSCRGTRLCAHARSRPCARCTANLALNGYVQAAAAGTALSRHPVGVKEGRGRRGAITGHAKAAQKAVRVQAAGMPVEWVKAWRQGKGRGRG